MRPTFPQHMYTHAAIDKLKIVAMGLKQPNKFYKFVSYNICSTLRTVQLRISHGLFFINDDANMCLCSIVA